MTPPETPLEKRVDIFFYGTFMDGSVLGEHGINSPEVVPAGVGGYKLYVRPRVNLKTDDRGNQISNARH